MRADSGRTDGNQLVQQALVEAAARHTVAVVPHEGIELATGVCVRFGEGLWIVTAKHAVNEWGTKNLYFIPRPPAPLVLGNTTDISRNLGTLKAIARIRLPIGHYREAADELDLAAFRIDEPMQTMEFHVLDPEKTSPSSGEQVLIFGLVAQTMREVTHVPSGETGWAVFPFADWPTPVEYTGSNLLSYSSDLHFLMDFPLATPPQDYDTEPGGLSGAGIWRLPLRLRQGRVWDPREIVLCGVQTSWYREHRLLKATRVEPLVELLAGALG